MKQDLKFNGYIDICDTRFFCSVEEHICSVFPNATQDNNSTEESLPEKIKELSGNTAPKGVYGFEPIIFESRYLEAITEQGNPARMLVQQAPICHFPLSGTNLSSYQFCAPIIVRCHPKAASPTDLSFFDAITFSGESVNLAYNPKCAIAKTGSKEFLEQQKRAHGAITIETKPWDDYTRSFGVSVSGIEAEFTYSISHDNEGSNLTNSSLGALNSFVRLAFKGKQPIEMVEKCYLQVGGLIQFLLGRQNIGFNIYLSQRVRNTSMKEQFSDENQDLFCNAAEVFISDGYEDYCDIRFDHSIQISHLEDDLPKLFALFGEDVKDRRPHLLMLPLSNRRAKYIYRSDVVDLCAALEKEYKLKRAETKKDDTRSGLLAELKRATTEYQANNPVDGNFYDSVNSSIENILLPVKERIMYLWEQSIDEKIDEDGKETIKQQIASFVNLRNKIAHVGEIDRAEDHLAYTRLLRTLYYSVLIREGFSDEQSKHIARQKFQ